MAIFHNTVIQTEKTSLAWSSSTVIVVWLSLVMALYLTFNDPLVNHQMLLSVHRRAPLEILDKCPLSYSSSSSSRSSPLNNSHFLNYAVVIDAGSTGTRVHVYEFRQCPVHVFNKNHAADFKLTRKNNSSTEVTLVDEVFREVQPGLSSYSDNPYEAARSINALIQEAKLRVPLRLQALTPLTVQATAGLRLLSEMQVNGIVQAINEQLRRRSPFPVQGVKVIDGSEEGYLAWLAVRFLLKESDMGAVVMDLGGASTQIVFAVNSTNHSNEDHSYYTMATLPSNGRLVSVFRHSYLGLGLMEMRKRLKQAYISRNNIHKNSTEGSGFECFPEGYQESNFSYPNATTTMINGKGDFWKCRQRIMQLLNLKEGSLGVDGVPQPPITPNRPVIAFSYFYDRTVMAGLKSPISPRDIVTLGERLCKEMTKGQEQWCLDVAYIHTLLTVVYGLRPDHQMTVIKQIDGWEAGWALGAGLQLISSQTTQH